MGTVTLLVALAAALAGQRGGRLRPPEAVACDPNKLTSFTGQVVSYARDAKRVSLTVRTDEETTEKFAVPNHKRFLLRSEPFRARWNAIEQPSGRLHPGMRATVWVCEGGASTVIDWQPPQPKDQGAR